MVWTQLMLDKLTCLLKRDCKVMCVWWQGKGWGVSLLILPSATPAAKTKPSTRPHNKSEGSERSQENSSEVDRSIPFSNPATHLYTAWLRNRLKITVYLCKFQFYYFFSFLNSNIQFYYIFLCLIQLKLFNLCITRIDNLFLYTRKSLETYDHFELCETTVKVNLVVTF